MSTKQSKACIAPRTIFHGDSGGSSQGQALSPLEWMRCWHLCWRSI